MNRTLAILGAGGHGRVVADCARAMERWSSIVYYDDNAPSEAATRGHAVAGGLEALFEVDSGRCEVIVAIGDGALRLDWLRRAQRSGMRIATVVHPSAVLSPEAMVGPGTVLVAGAVVNTGAVLGSGCIVNTLSSIDHDCRLADGVHVSPGAHLAGNVIVGEASWIGIGSVVRQGITIGKGVVVGAGAAVVADVDDGQTVVGVPARPIRR